MYKSITVAVMALALGGCASIVNETTHPMKVETLTESGQAVTGAECKMTNDYGSVSFKSGDTAQARRSSKDMDVTCTHPENKSAIGRLISRANAGLAGNILIGGGIGAIIDHNRGTAYTYPTWIQMVFGKTMVFDRSNEKEGKPVQGTDPAASEPAK